MSTEPIYLETDVRKPGDRVHGQGRTESLPEAQAGHVHEATDLQNPRRRTRADHHEYVAGDRRMLAAQNSSLIAS